MIKVKILVGMHKYNRRSINKSFKNFIRTRPSWITWCVWNAPHKSIWTIPYCLILQRTVISLKSTARLHEWWCVVQVTGRHWQWISATICDDTAGWCTKKRWHRLCVGGLSVVRIHFIVELISFCVWCFAIILTLNSQSHNCK